jgi:formylglycine-generating enzyme required for sulfatase activity
VVFKLPSKEEWIFAANKGDTSKMYTWGTGFMQNNRKQYLCNFKHTNFVYDSATQKYNEIKDEQENIILSPINAFYPNSFGLYNMCGNVAEMLLMPSVEK